MKTLKEFIKEQNEQATQEEDDLSEATRGTRDWHLDRSEMHYKKAKDYDNKAKTYKAGSPENLINRSKAADHRQASNWHERKGLKKSQNSMTRLNKSRGRIRF